MTLPDGRRADRALPAAPGLAGLTVAAIRPPSRLRPMSSRQSRKWKLPTCAWSTPGSLAAAPTVTLTLIAGSAVPVIGAVVNAASYVVGVAPGSLATLFGVNLDGATVLLNGTDVRPF